MEQEQVKKALEENEFTLVLFCVIISNFIVSIIVKGIEVLEKEMECEK